MQALALQGAQDTAPSCTSQGPPTPPCDLSLLCPPTPLTPQASSGLERHVCGCETEPQHSGTSRKPGKCPRLVPSWLGDASEGVQPGLSGCRPLPPHAPGESSDVPCGGGRGYVGVKDSQTRLCCQLEMDEGSTLCF